MFFTIEKLPGESIIINLLEEGFDPSRDYPALWECARQGAFAYEGW